MKKIVLSKTVDEYTKYSIKSALKNGNEDGVICISDNSIELVLKDFSNWIMKSTDPTFFSKHFKICRFLSSKNCIVEIYVEDENPIIFRIRMKKIFYSKKNRLEDESIVQRSDDWMLNYC